MSTSLRPLTARLSSLYEPATLTALCSSSSARNVANLVITSISNSLKRAERASLIYWICFSLIGVIGDVERASKGESVFEARRESAGSCWLGWVFFFIVSDEEAVGLSSILVPRLISQGTTNCLCYILRLVLCIQ